MTKILGVTGYKGHGKDSLAKMVVGHDNSWHIAHFSDPLKNMAMSVFGLTPHQVFDDIGKEEKFDIPVKMDDYLKEMCEVTGISLSPLGLTADSSRKVLQYFGTDYVRASAPNYWIDRFGELLDSYEKVIVADLRFLNEEKFLRSRDAFLVRVSRLDVPLSGDLHPSETEIALLHPHLELGTLTGKFALQYKVANLLSSLQLDSVLRYDYRSYEYLVDYYTV